MMSEQIKNLNEQADFNEKMVLSKLLNNPELINHFMLQPEHFQDERHGNLSRLLNNNPDFDDEFIMTEGITNSDLYGDYDFIRDIKENYFSSPHGFENQQEIIYGFYKHRESRKIMSEYIQAPSDEKLDLVYNKINSLNNSVINNIDSKRETLIEIFGKLHGEGVKPLMKTGVDDLDNIIDGFRENQLNVIAARPSAGKTAFSLQMALNMQNENTEVVFFSLETNEINLTERILSNLSGVPLKKFKNPEERMTNDEIDRINTQIGVYQKMNIKIRDGEAFTPNDIRKEAMNTVEGKNKIIVIDYLQIMRADNQTNSAYERASEISRELKLIATTTSNITIVAIAQLNRAVEMRQDKRPTMSDLRESGQIEQDADLIMLMTKSEEDEDIQPWEASKVNLNVAKNKDGPLGDIKLEFYKQVQRMR